MCDTLLDQAQLGLSFSNESILSWIYTGNCNSLIYIILYK